MVDKTKLEIGTKVRVKSREECEAMMEGRSIDGVKVICSDGMDMAIAYCGKEMTVLGTKKGFCLMRESGFDFPYSMLELIEDEKAEPNEAEDVNPKSEFRHLLESYCRKMDEIEMLRQDMYEIEDRIIRTKAQGFFVIDDPDPCDEFDLAIIKVTEDGVSINYGSSLK